MPGAGLPDAGVAKPRRTALRRRRDALQNPWPDRQDRSIVVLTKNGKDLLRRYHKNTESPRQAVYAGLVKPREIAHDAAIYRLYHAEAGRIEQQGGRVKRVVLDFELKKRAYSPLAKAQKLGRA